MPIWAALASPSQNKTKNGMGCGFIVECLPLRVCWEDSGLTVQLCYTWRYCMARPLETVLYLRGEILCNSQWWIWELIQQLPVEYLLCKRCRDHLSRPLKSILVNVQSSVLSLMQYIDLTLKWLAPKILLWTFHSDDAGSLGRFTMKQGGRGHHKTG